MNREGLFAWLSRRIRLGVILGLALASGAALLALPPIPQPPDYHHFADKRPFFDLPNFLNVISNVPFLVVGGLGLAFLLKPPPAQVGGAFKEQAERRPYVMLLLGVTLTALGSAYYHLAPDNQSLFWDRLPMTLVFMGFFAAVITERIHVKAGLFLLFPLVILGVASVLYWHYTELQGRGDLRLYAWVQFFPMMALPLILLLFPPRYTRSRDWWVVLALYALAKVFEVIDENIYAWGRMVSGHTLKHLTAALATYGIVRMLKRRQPLVRSNKNFIAVP